MHDIRWIALAQQRFELLPELICRLEFSCWIEILTKRAVKGAWDVSGNRIQRLSALTL